MPTVPTGRDRRGHTNTDNRVRASASICLTRASVSAHWILPVLWGVPQDVSCVLRSSLACALLLQPIKSLCHCAHGSPPGRKPRPGRGPDPPVPRMSQPGPLSRPRGWPGTGAARLTLRASQSLSPTQRVLLLDLLSRGTTNQSSGQTGGRRPSITSSFSLSPFAPLYVSHALLRWSECVSPPGFVSWNLTPVVMEWGGGACERCWGHEGEALRNGVSALIMWPEKAPSPILPGEDGEKLAVCNPEPGPCQNPTTVLDLQPPELWEIHSRCLQASPSVGFCYSSLKGLRHLPSLFSLKIILQPHSCCIASPLGQPVSESQSGLGRGTLLLLHKTQSGLCKTVVWRLQSPPVSHLPTWPSALPKIPVFTWTHLRSLHNVDEGTSPKFLVSPLFWSVGVHTPLHSAIHPWNDPPSLPLPSLARLLSLPSTPTLQGTQLMWNGRANHFFPQ